ncbi:MAG: response regulator, partial [Gammaproteobacteria bacterium]|nr:response regulator [Gammaproteobacteria bacterium]
RWGISFRAKLGLLFGAGLLIVLVCWAATLLVLEHRRVYADAINVSETAVNVIRQDLARVTLANSPQSAAEVVNRLAAFSAIRQAVLFNDDQEPIFEYRAEGAEGLTNLSWAAAQRATADGSAQAGHMFSVVQPIEYSGQSFGHVYFLLCEANALTQTAAFRKAALPLIGFLVLVALVVTLLAHRMVAKPMRVLVEFAEQVGRDENYSIRTNIASDDEIGTLGTTLNILLDRFENTQLALDDERLRLLTTLEALSEGVIAIDANNRISFVNPVGEQLLGRNDTVGREVQAVFSVAPDSDDGFDRLITTNGLCRVVAASSADIRLHNGELAGRVFVLRDASVEAEAKRELLAAVAASREAAAVKDEFLGNISHEIRTPLNGIVGTLQLLDAHTPLEEQQEVVEILSSSADVLLKLINEVLDFSKLEADELTLQSDTFDAGSLVEEVVQAFADDTDNPKVDIASCIEVADARATGDQGRLRQVMTNLVSNAVKFTPAGHIVARVCKSSNPGSLRFEVEDTGIGIDPELVDRLFSPFTQADGSNTREFGGTGLGLAICDGLVRLMGGEIVVSSALKRGSTFAFELPISTPTRADIPTNCAARRVHVLTDQAGLREVVTRYNHDLGFTTRCAHGPDDLLQAFADGDICVLDQRHGASHHLSMSVQPESLILLLDKAQPSPIYAKAWVRTPIRRSDYAAKLREVHDAHSARETSSVSPLSGRVLLAEDIRTNQFVAERLLSTMGLDVVVANNGAEVMALLAESQFDLILMDLHMPVLNGFEATKQIRQLIGPVSRIPVVAMTADVSAGVDKSCQEAGMDGYLSKPVSAQQLREILTDKLNPARVEHAATAATS